MTATATIRKGDVVARVSSHVMHFGFGTGRKPETYHTIEIVRVDSASKDGRVKRYQTSPTSPCYIERAPAWAAPRYLTISGDNQPAARRLFDAATSTDALRFDRQEDACAAIRAA